MMAPALSLAELACKKTKEAILRHMIVSGELLSHNDLVLRLKIGQTSIREALSRMVEDGYLTRVANRGYRVRELTAEEVHELLELRQVLEAYCVDEAIRRITPDGIDALKLSVKASRKSISTNQPLLDRYLIHKDFHLILAEIAGNDAVCRVLQDTCEKLVLKQRSDGDSRGGFGVLRHHREILGAIENRDTKKARELLKSHLDEIKHTVLKQIAARKQEA